MVRHVIVGGGIAGLASAWWLARAGLGEVVLLEAEGALARQASGRNAAILRTWIDEPVAARLARRSKPFLLAPPAGFAGEPLVDRRGLVLMADREPAAARLVAHAQETRARGAAGGEAETPFEALDAAGLARRAPHVGTRALCAFHLPDEGSLAIEALAAGFARGAQAAGARLVLGARVLRLAVDGQRVRGVELAGGERLEADRVHLCAGAWAGALAAAAGSPVRLRPTRRHLAVSARDPRVDPRWPVVWNAGEAFYARPEAGGLLFCLCDQDDVDPGTCAVDPAMAERLAAALARHLPMFAGAGAERLWCGMRTLTADERFALGPDPRLEGLAWVAGLGGHGMTAAPEVGRLAAVASGAEEPRRPGDGDLLAALDPARLAARGAGPVHTR